MDRSLILLSLALLGCGGAPRPQTRAEPEPAPIEAPPEPAPRMHTITLAAALPPGTRTSGGIDPEGAFYCRQTYVASPPQDERLCMANGHGVTAHVLHVVDASGAARTYLESAIEVRRISDCGNEERPLRRVPPALATRLAPGLAIATGAREVDLRAVQFASCGTGDLALRMPDGVRAEVRGAVLRLSGAGAISLVRGEVELRGWSLEEGGAGLELEAICNERFAVVSGGLVADGGDATRRDESVPCVPSASLRAASWQSFERIRIDLASGDVSAIELDAPALTTDP